MTDRLDKRYVLLVVTLSSFFPPLISTGVNIALPSIGEELTMDAVMLGWVPSSYLLASAVFLIPFGRIADIYGLKKILTYGILITIIASLLTAISTSGVMLIILRFSQGIGAAMTFGTSVAIVTSVFTARDVGKALGVTVAGVYSGGALGPFIGGFLTEHFGWRSIFLLMVPLGLIAVSFIFWKIREDWAEAEGEKFDYAGSILFGSTLIAIMYALSILPEISAIWLILASALGMSVFFKWEMKVGSPILDVRILSRNSVFTFSTLATLIYYSSIHAISFLLSLYLQYIKGLSPQSAGLILVTQQIVMTMLSPIAGRLSDKIEPRVLTSIGIGLTTIGIASFAFLNETTSLGIIISGLMLLGVGFALFSSPNVNAIMSSVEKRYRGVASGIFSTMRVTGNMLSMGITMTIFTVFIGRVQITPSNYPLFLQSVNMAFTFFAGLSLLAILVSLKRGKVRLNSNHNDTYSNQNK